MASAFPSTGPSRLFFQPEQTPRKIFFDVALLREFIATRYGQALAYDIDRGHVNAGMRLVRRLATIAETSVEQALDDVLTQYEVQN